MSAEWHTPSEPPALTSSLILGSHLAIVPAIMPSTLSLREVQRRCVELTCGEALALVQQLIASLDEPCSPIPPFGPPSIDNIYLSPDGAVVCTGCAATPAVSEMGRLLSALLPRGGAGRVPGAVRYIIARASMEVDVPPFDSLAQLSAALVRHEQPNRPAILKALYERATRSTVAAPDIAPVAFVNRRRASPAADELRRRLREADEALFVRSQHAGGRPRAAQWALAGAAAALLAFGAGYARVHQLHPVAATHTVAHRPATAAAEPSRARSAPRAIDRPSVPSPVESIAPRPSTSDRGRTPAPERHPRVAAQPAVMRAVGAGNGPSFSPAFAPDGTALFFHTGRSSDAHSALEAESLRGDDLRVMTIVDDGAKNYHVQPSPDGTQVAFDSDRDGERGVYIANRDGTGVRRVSGSGYAAVPAWSPDGRRLAFIRAEPDTPRVWNLWLLELASGDTRRLTSFRYGQTWSASWFPDGRRIAYTHEDRLIVRNLDTGATREYATPVAGRLVRTPAVSPDGEHIMFQVSRSGGWLLTLGNGSMRCVLPDPTAEEFAWAPDGRRVAFHSRRDGQWGIWLMTAS
jgi:hypothetical protein